MVISRLRFSSGQPVVSSQWSVVGSYSSNRSYKSYSLTTDY